MNAADRGTELILASGSPRRARLLKEIVPSFRVLPGNVDEDREEGESPSAYVMRVSRKKAESVSDGLEPDERGAWILAGDTVVVVGETVLGKPKDSAEAMWMLEELQDRRHEVITGICLLNRSNGVCCLDAVRTRVWMKKIEPQERKAYIETGEPFDKAGGYAIQGHGRRFVLRIDGSYSNVVGLPVERIRELFLAYGVY